MFLMSSMDSIAIVFPYKRAPIQSTKKVKYMGPIQVFQSTCLPGRHENRHASYNELTTIQVHIENMWKASAKSSQ